MSKVSTCLKRTFTVFNALFAIIGALIIVFTFQHQIVTNFRLDQNAGNELYILYIVGTVTMLVAILGAVGAHKESKACLSVFLGCMVTGTLVMLMYAIPVAVSRNKVEERIEMAFHSFVPLDKAPEKVQSSINTFQEEVHCCGLFSYTDWENIPESCKCSPMEDECNTVNDGIFTMTRVYSKTCFPIIMDKLQVVITVLIGITFTLGSLALLGTILSSILIHQMRSSVTPTLVLSLPTTFISSPPKYEKFEDQPPAYC